MACCGRAADRTFSTWATPDPTATPVGSAVSDRAADNDHTAAANELPGAVAEEVKEERWHRLMSVQQEVSRELNAARVGQEIDVIVDDVDEEGAIARSKWDAPEIDGSVFLNSAKDLAQGDIVRARIVASDAYDVWAEGGA